MMKTIENYTYKISENIGKGFSSTVHKGVNDKNGHPVSIKVIEMVKLEDPINQMLLQHQIMALKSLAHSQYVLHLYDVYATKNNTYIITELCEGDLASVLKKRKAIPYPEAVEILEQIIKGYIDVNASGYLHRDIKPANIFFKGSSYKIGDFGFAIPSQQIEKHKNYNVGSPVYMPPEALKDNIYSVSCDTWAIGIIFFQILKGVVPWRAVTEQKLHEKLLAEPLDSITVGLPEIARQFLAKVLALDPKSRINIEQMQGWCSKLSSVQIVSKPQLQPLREIKNIPHNNLLIVPPSGKNQNRLFLTPKQNSGHQFQFHPIPIPPPTQKNCTNPQKVQFLKPQLSPMKDFKSQLSPLKEFKPQLSPMKDFKLQGHIQIQDSLLKQAEGLASNMANYMKFMHKVVNFVESSPDMNYLVSAMRKNLLEEIDLFESFVITPSICIFQRWEQFLDTKKGRNFQEKFNKSKLKYRMLHSSSECQECELDDLTIKEGLKKILDRLQNESNNKKLIVGADYLTTMFMLWHLRNKYGLVDFFKMSKIDLIMQGDPYNASQQHLSQLRRKISLIDVFN